MIEGALHRGGYSSRFLFNLRHPYTKPIDKVYLILERIFRDKPVYRDSYLKSAQVIANRYSGMPHNTFSAVEKTCGYGLYYRYEWDIPNYLGGINACHEARAERLRYCSVLNKKEHNPYIENEFWCKEDNYNQIRDRDNKLPHTRLSKCVTCGRFFKVSNHRKRTDWLFSGYDGKDCRSCASKYGHYNRKLKEIHERENDLKECRRLMREIKQSIKGKKDENYTRA